jgi:hypothetical protein
MANICRIHFNKDSFHVDMTQFLDKNKEVKKIDNINETDYVIYL